MTENAFGIMTSVFRIFCSKINLSPDKATKVFLSAVVLHNLLRSKCTNTYTPTGFADEIHGENIIDGSWRIENNVSAFQPLPPQKYANKSKKTAENIRDYFAEYFYGPGAVPWQWKVLL